MSLHIKAVSLSATELVQKHSPRVLKRTITEPLGDDDWKGYDAIRVICRFRPSNKSELAYSRTKGVADIPPQWESDQTVRLMRPPKDKSKSRSSNKPYKCTLDAILETNTTQKKVFYLVGQPMILSCLEGFNSTIFAYGQSGSGKTYTMFGPEDDATNIAQFGLIPRCFIYLFQKLNESLSNNGGNLQDYTVTMELLQIYKRDLLDLMNPNSKSKLIIKTDFRNDSVFVQNCHSIQVNTVEEAFACLTEAQSNRIVAGHALNSVSSRSHMLVIVNIVQRGIDGTVKRSKLNFGDLAGSEDLTKALGKNPDPVRRKEAIAINSSLSALTTAMSFLSKGKKPGYRDSPLTHILKDSLGGNAKTIMFVACSPHIYNRNETIRALRFAATAKKVKNKAKKNEERSPAVLKKRIKVLELKVVTLQAQLVEARGKQKIYKQMTLRRLDENDSRKQVTSEWSGSDTEEPEVLSDEENEEELNYVHQISELRKKLEDALQSNNTLNEEITSKNIELEQCSNRIAKLMAEVESQSQYPKQHILVSTAPAPTLYTSDAVDEDGITMQFPQKHVLVSSAPALESRESVTMLKYLMDLQTNERKRRNTIENALDVHIIPPNTNYNQIEENHHQTQVKQSPCSFCASLWKQCKSMMCAFKCCKKADSNPLQDRLIDKDVNDFDL
eukprot:922734_1